MQLQRSNGQLVTFASRRVLGVGGEARILEVLDPPGLAAKLYHRPTGDHAAKLSAMLANRPVDPMASRGHASIAWPLEVLRASDGSGRVMGFLMPLVSGMNPIIDFYHPRTRRHRHPLFSYLYLLRTARNLAACVGALHARGYVIGDLNESNILVAETALVTIVDTDSFQVPDAFRKRLYRCGVGKPEFTPPELQTANFSEVDRQTEHDLFGLAVLIFQLLMEGTHPFAGRHSGVGDPPSLEQRIAAGQFPYAGYPGNQGLPMPLALPFDILDPCLRGLFLRCFVDGHHHPGQRPNAQTWQFALEEAEAALTTCSTNAQHCYGKHLRACPWCERRNVLRGLDPFPSRGAVKRSLHLRVVSPPPKTVQVPLRRARSPAPSRAPLPRVPRRSRATSVMARARRKRDYLVYGSFVLSVIIALAAIAYYARRPNRPLELARVQDRLPPKRAQSHDDSVPVVSGLREPPSEAAPLRGAASDSANDALAPVEIRLPKPMFVGTPQDGRVPNLEKPLGRPRPPFLAPQGTTNVAVNKAISGSDEEPIIGDLEMITDGDKEAADGSYVELGPFVQYVTIDLEKQHEIYAIVVWHYHKQPRVYFDVVAQLSNDPDFIGEVTTVFNNDIDNSAGLGIGKDKHYVETSEGKLIDCLSQGSPKARYVRLYSDGNTSNDLNHYIEVDVYGRPVE